MPRTPGTTRSRQEGGGRPPKRCPMSTSEVDAILAEVFGRYSSGWQPAEPLADLIEVTPYAVLTDLVRPAGLAKQKAARVQGILQRIFRDTGAYSLDFLRTAETRSATRYLCSLPGVGPHTAALVLVFAVGRPGVMPVDGHVQRVARRLGWAPKDATPHAVQQAIEKAAEGQDLMDLHVNLIRLGHRHCGEGMPDCPGCPVSDHCASARVQNWW